MDKKTSNKLNTIAYWVSTAIMCSIFLFSAGMYFFKHDMVVGFFEQLGHPSYLIYPLATAKILGVIAVLCKKFRMLTEWAYAGFFFDAVLAFSAHTAVGDGAGAMSLIAMIMVMMSRFFETRVFYGGK